MQKKIENIDQLPKDIKQSILQFLPDEDLRRVAQLDKHWNGFFKPESNDLRTFECYQKKQAGIVKIYAKYHSAFAVEQIGQQHVLFATGKNFHGALGIGDYVWQQDLTFCLLPSEVKEIKDIAIAPGHSLILYQDTQNQFKIVVAGNNQSGQLGAAIEQDGVNIFTPFSMPETLKKPAGICAGTDHSHIWGYGEDGKLEIWASGNNESGQLGIGSVDNKAQLTSCTVPVDLERIDGMAAGDDFTLIWGKNVNHKPQIWITSDPKNKGTFSPWSFGGKVEEIRQVCTGHGHAVICAIDKNKQHKLWVCGQNQHGQLGLNDFTARDGLEESPLPENLDTILGISASDNHTILWGIDKNQQHQVWDTGDARVTSHWKGAKNHKAWTNCALPRTLKTISHVHGMDDLRIQGTDQNNKPQIWIHNSTMSPPTLPPAFLLDSRLPDVLKQAYCHLTRTIQKDNQRYIRYRRSNQRIMKAVNQCFIDLADNQLTLKDIQTLYLDLQVFCGANGLP